VEFLHVHLAGGEKSERTIERSFDSKKLYAPGVSRMMGDFPVDITQTTQQMRAGVRRYVDGAVV
jgi:hypothetical protein